MRRLLLALATIAPLALAQGTLEVIPLRHRTADQVIPVLRPMLEPGGVLTGQYNQHIVRTSAANLAQLRAALEAIDVAARRLVISVRFDSAGDFSRSGIEGDARISNRGTRAEVRAGDSRGAREERIDQRLQVLEGGRALISAGESRPYTDAATGFAVVPRVSGSSVFLEVAAQSENFARGGAVQGQRAVSTVSGRLGEWIELGGTEVARARKASGILSSRESGSAGTRRIWVRVEEIAN